MTAGISCRTLVALADDFKLCLAAVAADDLGPGQRNELRDAQK